jgi:hypothetical protein
MDGNSLFTMKIREARENREEEETRELFQAYTGGKSNPTPRHKRSINIRY